MPEHMTAAEYRKLGKRRNKYHAIRVPKCACCGFSHDSQMEAARCAYWHARMEDTHDNVTWVDHHPTVSLSIGVKWTLDFGIWQDMGGSVYYTLEDVKGVVTRDCLTKYKLCRATHFARVKTIYVRFVRGRRDRSGNWRWEEIEP